MSKDNMKVLEYQIHYPTLNSTFEKEDKMMFDLGIIYAYSNECGKGFKVKKVSKTSKKGTKFTYESIKSEEDFEEYKLLINDMVNKFNKEYDLQLCAKEVKK